MRRGPSGLPIVGELLKKWGLEGRWLKRPLISTSVIVARFWASLTVKVGFTADVEDSVADPVAD
jgi:hypothetical protein